MSSQNKPATKYDLTLGELGAKLEVSAVENEANVAVVEHTLSPHSLAAPLHRHSREDEISYVLEGEMTVLADEELSSIGEGEFVVKGRNVWHTFWNATDHPLRFLEIIAPGTFATYFEEIADVFPIDPTNREKIARAEELNDRYGFEFDLESIPRLCEEYGLQL